MIGRRALLALTLPLAAALVASCTAGEQPPVAREDATPPATETATASRTPLARPSPLPTLPPRVEPGLPVVTPTAGPSVLGPDGLPAGEHGLLLVYRRVVERDVPFAVGLHEVVTYDFRSKREIVTFRVGGSHPRLLLAGNRVLVNFGRVLVSYALDGTGGITLWQAGPHETIGSWSLQPSEDGRLVAFSVACMDEEECDGYGDPNRIYAVDTQTGEERLRFEANEETLPGFEGMASPIGWRDGAVILGGFFESERVGDAAVLTLDGEVTRHGTGSREWARLRGELWTEYSGGEHGCSLADYGGVQRIVLTDLETGEELAWMEADAPVLTFHGVGPGRYPDRGEMLIAEHIFDHGDRAELRRAVEEGRCAAIEWQRMEQVRVQSWLVPFGGGEPWRVESLLEAHRRWYGPRLVSYACLDAEALYPYDLSRQTDGKCDASKTPVEVRVGGQRIGMAIEPGVLGFIEPSWARPAPATPEGGRR